MYVCEVEHIPADPARIAQLADEQAALRRIATLVARGVSPDVIFETVTDEVHGLLGGDVTALNRFDPDGLWTVIAVRGMESNVIGAGERWDPGEAAPGLAEVFSGRPVRVDTYSPIGSALDAIIEAERAVAWIGSPIQIMGQTWGTLSVLSRRGPLPAGAEHRLVDFTELVATAIANAESHAQLIASRARIVAAGDEARRRIQRDLHDGAQQRVVTLALKARELASSDAARACGIDSDLLDLVGELGDVLNDLREISSGLHPAALSKGGLQAALNALARRAAIPVVLDVDLSGRLDESVEIAAYYVVAEALTNAAKHANATRVEVSVDAPDGALRIRVCDDGVGGANPAGSGLLGLRDRAEALGGTVTLDSPRGHGTTLVATLPLDDGPAGG